MLFPGVVVYRSRVRSTVTTDFSGRIAIERGMRARMIVIPLEVCKLSLEVSRVPEQSVVQKLTANGSDESLYEGMRYQGIRDGLDFPDPENPQVGLPSVISE